MGGSVSSGKDNDELVDNLVEGGLIKTPMIERVFRAVDRGLYFLPEFREAAYRDLAWREGHIHLSAPCIYSRVMEALELEAGHAFLNVGSGTGYFSTMAGLIIGYRGLNHNIELHKELVDYSRQKLKEFVRSSTQFDDFDFCVPKFINGNILNLNVEDNSGSVDHNMVLYDRIYVGVGVHEENEDLIKNLLKVNGVLVMPINDSLMKIKRIDEENWSRTSLMTVSFATLIMNESEKFSLPRAVPYSLQDLCRSAIRAHLRGVIEQELPDYYTVKRFKSTFNKDYTINKRRSSRRDSQQQQSNDDDEEDASAGSSDDGMLFADMAEIFTPRRHSSQRIASNNNSHDLVRRISNDHNDAAAVLYTNNPLHNQLRLMIYRGIFQTNTNRFAIALDNRRDSSSSSSDSDREVEDHDEGVRDVADIVTSVKKKEAEETDEEEEEETAESIRLRQASRTIPIPLPYKPIGGGSDCGSYTNNNNNNNNSSSSVGESGFSENSADFYDNPTTSTSASAASNTKEAASTGAGATATAAYLSFNDDDHDDDSSASSVAKKKKNDDDDEEEEKEKEEENDDSLAELRLSDEFKKRRVLERKRLEMDNNAKKNRVNMMQRKINDLPVSVIIRNFLLYHRPMQQQ